MENSRHIFDLYIVTGSGQYGDYLKQLLDRKLKSNVVVQVFSGGETCMQELEKGKRPNIIVLDYMTDGLPQDGWDKNTVFSRIHAQSPDTLVIVISDPEDAEQAMKTVAYGAFDYVSKDEFSFSHIVEAVKTCLYPSKV